MNEKTHFPGCIFGKEYRVFSHSFALMLTFILILAATLPGLAQDPVVPEHPSPIATLEKADSLFGSRQYTQALDLYQSLRAQNVWSPAMLLKMAYIEEALGRLGESLYYVNLYYIASHDPQALIKMEEMADKKHLEGYGEDSFEPVRTTLREYYLQISGLLVAVSLLITAILVNRARQKKKPSIALTLLVVILAATLYAHANYSWQFNRVIISHPGTYLMSGPSSASSVVEIIGEGHQLQVTGKQDVWLRVKWRNSDAYVKDFLVRSVEL